MAEVTLSQMLQARDERAETQRRLLSVYRLPLVCFTMNIAGPVKNTPLIERAFLDGLATLENVLPCESIRYKQVDFAVTGCQAFFVVDMPASRLKQHCIAIETATSSGRLFDMDVLDTDGKKLERTVERGCIVCGAQGRSCAAGRRHTVAELQACTYRILYDHFVKADREKIAALATDCLVREVLTTPKPGLVDRRNNGSHTDMTLQTFLDSASALKPYFAECFDIGRTNTEQTPAYTFALLREAGKRAEHTMFSATHGVNTHKGAIYSMGALCGSIGRLWSPEQSKMDIESVAKTCADLVAQSVYNDLHDKASNSAGLCAYRKEGITGIRGEVAAGFPSVMHTSIPAYRDALNQGLDDNHAGVIALLHLIGTVQDTTLYHRGGIDGMKYAADTVRELLESTPYPSVSQIEALDDAFISRNLSPGGSADLLAVTYFLNEIKRRE